MALRILLAAEAEGLKSRPGPPVAPEGANPGGVMLSDLAALTPPFLIAVAFLVGAWAFLRHEMRRGKNPVSGDDPADYPPDSASGSPEDATDQRSVSGSLRENPDEGGPDSGI
jgi:hypothetical protein